MGSTFPDDDPPSLNIDIFVGPLAVVTTKVVIPGNTTASLPALVGIDEVESTLGVLWRVCRGRVRGTGRPGAPGGLAAHVPGWRVATNDVSPSIGTLSTGHSDLGGLGPNHLRPVSCWNLNLRLFHLASTCRFLNVVMRTDLPACSGRPIRNLLSLRFSLRGSSFSPQPMH